MGNKFVYLIRAGRFYKIGVTSSLKDRVSSLQTGNPKKITIVKAAIFDEYKRH